MNQGVVKVAMVGAGNFATGMHLPNLQKLSAKYGLHAVMSRTGLKAKEIAARFGAAYATTNFDEILGDREVDLVMICTRHDSHAELALRALAKGKNVFVEKPLATNRKDLEQIAKFYQTTTSERHPVLMAGFNRRFSRFAREIKKHTDKKIGPLFIRYRMNAGYIPLDNWVHEHGGRITGEACHIIDLMSFFTGERIESVSYESLDPRNSKFTGQDNKSIILKYHDGSLCAIDYFAVGSSLFPKEYMEVHFDEKTIIMDDYKTLKGYGVKIDEISVAASQKGQLEELEALYKSLKGDATPWPIALWDMLQTTEISLRII